MACAATKLPSSLAHFSVKEYFSLRVYDEILPGIDSEYRFLYDIEDTTVAHRCHDFVFQVNRSKAEDLDHTSLFDDVPARREFSSTTDTSPKLQKSPHLILLPFQAI